MTITEFLTARMDEDEALARESIIDASHWSVFAVNEHFGQVDSDDGAIANSVDLKDAAHIVRWDPAHVLADIAAKRALIADLATFDRVATEKVSSDPATSLTARGIERGIMHALRTLALPFTDHPDFDESWKP